MNRTNDSQASQKIHSRSPSRKSTARSNSWQIAKNLPASFRYAFQGITYSFGSQRNFRIHLAIGAIAFGLATLLELDRYGLALVVMTVATVLILELVNTSIEAMVDLAVGLEFHPLAKTAKDCAAAAVFVASISSLGIAFLLFYKPLLTKLGL